jgi:hypothetical protein
MLRSRFWIGQARAGADASANGSHPYPMSGWPVLPMLGIDTFWRLAFAVNVVTVVLLELRMQHTFISRAHARPARG